MPVSFLTSSLGANAKLRVEIAWGANITLADSFWVWTDISEDVRQSPGISTAIGKADEASVSQPAICTLTLDNTFFKYSTTGISPNYPNVKRNVPVRVSVSINGVAYFIVFQGYATGFTPEWNIRGTVRNVKLVASGTLRRLLQGSSPVLSPIRRVLSEGASTVAYWPLEDGKNATYVAPGVGGANMSILGTAATSPKFAENTSFDASLPLPVLNLGGFDGGVPTYADTGSQQVRALFSFTNTAQVDQSTLIRVYTTGSITRWDLRYTTGGSMDFKGYDRFGTLIVNLGAVAYALHGKRVRLTVEMAQNGGNVDWKIGSYELAIEAAFLNTGTAVAHTVGTINRVQIAPDAGFTDTAVGHVSVENVITNQYDVRQQIDGYNDEDSIGSAGRLVRICSENSIFLSRDTPAYVGNSSSDRMGTQPISDVTSILREVEVADQGILYDGRSQGLIYTTRRARENRAADLTISAGSLKLAAPFTPVDDDQRTRNRVEAKKVRGASVVYEDSTGPLGTNTIGIYDTSLEVNTWREVNLGLYAGWFVNLGTLQGYRFPTLTINFRATPELATTWLGLCPGYRIDITDLGSVLAGLGTDTISLMVEGISNEISGDTWIGTVRCSPYEVWKTGLSSAPTGSTGDFLARADTSGSVTTATASPGATSLQVTTTTGPIWTTVADNYPMDLDVGGIKVTATACSGAASPQTFTINSLPYSRAAGLPVSLWQQPRLGL